MPMEDVLLQERRQVSLVDIASAPSGHSKRSKWTLQAYQSGIARTPRFVASLAEAISEQREAMRRKPTDCWSERFMF